MKLIAFLICSGIGYLLGRYLPDSWSAYVSILVSYHLFLGWLVITAEHDTGFSMPVLSTVLTHAACLALLIGLAIGQRYVPFLALVRIFVPGLAPFECNWLFAAGVVREKAPKDTLDTRTIASPTVATVAVASTSEAPAASEVQVESEAGTGAVTSAAPEAEYTAEEHTAWIKYLSRPRRAFRKPGISVGEEFKQWQAARAQYKAILSQKPDPD